MHRLQRKHYISTCVINKNKIVYARFKNSFFSKLMRQCHSWALSKITMSLLATQTDKKNTKKKVRMYAVYNTIYVPENGVDRD